LKVEGKEMLSKIPIGLEKVKDQDLNKETLRAAVIAELDAINLYEQMAAMVEDQDIRRVLLEVAREEKTHVGEFQALLLRKDEQQKRELEKGEEEVAELTR
jgi:rubrerythrin